MYTGGIRALSRALTDKRQHLPHFPMKLRQLTVFLGGYLATVAALARLYNRFSGVASTADIAICLTIALLIGFAAGTSETAARHGAAFVLASFCGAFTILLSFYADTARLALVALPYVFFWTNAAWLGWQAARICRTALNAPSAQ
jgi:fluoride ion exporter CrcB/FEX